MADYSPQELRLMARQAALRHRIDPDWFEAQIEQESNFVNHPLRTMDYNGKTIHVGGIAQIVPEYHPDVDVTDPADSLDYAARLMSSYLSQTGGDWTAALVRYNGGQGALNAWNAGQPYGESKLYVDRITAKRNQMGTPAPKVPGMASPPRDPEDNFIRQVQGGGGHHYTSPSELPPIEQVNEGDTLQIGPVRYRWGGPSQGWQPQQGGQEQSPAAPPAQTPPPLASAGPAAQDNTRDRNLNGPRLSVQSDATQGGTRPDVRPIGTFTLDSLTPTESGYYFPWHDRQMGGTQQAAYNVMKAAGLNPSGMAGDIYDTMTAGIPTLYWGSTALDTVGRLGNPNNNAPDWQDQANALRNRNVVDLFNEGRGSAIAGNDMPSVLQALAQIGQRWRGGQTEQDKLTPTQKEVAFQMNASPDDAGTMLASIMRPFLNPYAARGIPALIQRQLEEYRASGQQEHPLTWLARRYGYAPMAG